MAIDLPEIGQVDWGGDLNAALTQLDEQTVIGAERQGDDIVFLKNNGAELNLGNFKGDPGEPGEDGAPGPQGPQGPPGTPFETIIADDYAEPGDTSDSEAWQRAVDEIVANPSVEWRSLTSRKSVNRLHTGINWRGLKRVRIGGLERPITFQVSPGAGGPYTFNTAAGTTTNAPRITPTTPVSCFGDSLTADDPWVDRLASRSGATVYDLGLAGQTSTEIAFRAGALAVSVTLQDNEVKTSGTNLITAINPSQYWRDGTGVQYQLKVTLKAPSGDIPGTFYFKTATNTTMRFTPDTFPSSPISIPAGTPIEVREDPANKSGVGHENDSVIIWFGANNSSDLSVYIRDVQAMDAHFTGKKLWVAPHTGTNMPPGSAGYELRTGMRRALFDTVGPANVFDARQYITHELIVAMNIIPTATDVSNMENDTAPPSLFSDNVHITTTASDVLGNEIYRNAVQAEVVPEQPGDITEDVIFENIDFQGGATYVPDGVFDRHQNRRHDGDYLRAFVWGNGHRTPAESAMGVVNRVTIRNCKMYGSYTLPILLRGCSNIEVSDNWIKRCLDVGFIFTKGLSVMNNRVEWSGDNGLSLSRGCTQVTASGNRVEGSYYSGIMIGGFGTNVGPDHVTLTNNVVINSRMNGIQAIDGPSHVVIANNVVDGVRRGGASNDNRDYLVDSAPNDYGTGISISGRITSAGSGSSPTLDHRWAHEIVVTGNNVRNCDRNGIMVGAGTRRVTITGNQVTDIGSEYTVNGQVAIPSTHRYYNIAIGVYGLHAALTEDVVATGNTVVDTRSTPLINYGVSLANSVRGAQRSNYGHNLRNPQTF